MVISNTVVNPTSLAPAGPFSHALKIPAGHEIIFTAGQVGTIDAKGTVAETYQAQVEAAIRNLDVVLRESGATPQDIIKLTYYIVDYGSFGSFLTYGEFGLTLEDVGRRLVHINALQKFLGGHKPATTLVGVPKLASSSLKFEIEAVAAIKPLSRL